MPRNGFPFKDLPCDDGQPSRRPNSEAAYEYVCLPRFGGLCNCVYGRCLGLCLLARLCSVEAFSSRASADDRVWFQSVRKDAQYVAPEIVLHSCSRYLRPVDDGGVSQPTGRPLEERTSHECEPSTWVVSIIRRGVHVPRFHVRKRNACPRRPGFNIRTRSVMN